MSLESKKASWLDSNLMDSARLVHLASGLKRGNRPLEGLLNGGGAHCIDERCSLFVVKCVDLSALDQQLVD
jgi:hypothetical protein